MKMLGSSTSDQTFQTVVLSGLRRPTLPHIAETREPQVFDTKEPADRLRAPSVLHDAVSGFHFSGLQDAACGFPTGRGETRGVTLGNASQANSPPSSNCPTASPWGVSYGQRRRMALGISTAAADGTRCRTGGKKKKTGGSSLFPLVLIANGAISSLQSGWQTLFRAATQAWRTAQWTFSRDVVLQRIPLSRTSDRCCYPLCFKG